MIDFVAGVIAAAILIFTFIWLVLHVGALLFVLASIPSLIRHRREIFGGKPRQPKNVRLNPAGPPEIFRPWVWQTEGCPVCGQHPVGVIYATGQRDWPAAFVHSAGHRCETFNFRIINPRVSR